MKPTIFLGADHAGFNLKQSLHEHLSMLGFHVEDVGAHELDPSDDYPPYAAAVATAVVDHPGSFGLLACGNAEGVCIAANKFDGIRAGVGFSIEAAATMRGDDDANVICLPGRVQTADDPLKIAEAFLTKPFSGADRHVRRIKQVKNIEKRGAVHIIPAMLVKSEEQFRAKLAHLALIERAPVWQIDILDGSMFEAVSYANPIILNDLSPLPQFELHLMVENPLPYIELWQKQCPTLRRAIIHAEITRSLQIVLDKIRHLGLETGLAINPETPIAAVVDQLSRIDRLLIMGVNPGKSGQVFIGNPILQKIHDARSAFPNLTIAVDGGVTQENASEIFKAGANELCVASALWETSDPVAGYESLEHAAWT